jgi:vitamin B12 transporter
LKNNNSRSLSAPIILFAATFVAGAGSSLAAAADDSLEEVQISANRLEETLPLSLAQFGTRVDTITREQILDGSYVDVSQALQALAPALSIQPKNGPFDYADISLLGSRTQDVLWLVDGVRINNRLYGTTPPVDTLPAAMVDRIEVLDGGQALFYGTSAVAGAINIVTKPFTDNPDGALTFAADTNDSRHVDARFSDSLNGNHIVLYGTTDRSDGYRAFRNQDYQPSATSRDRGYSVQTIGVKYGYELGDRLRLSGSYQHTDADLDYAQPWRVARDVNSRREELATVKLDYTLNDRLSLFVKAYYHQWHTHYDTLYNDLATPGLIDVLYSNAFWGYDDRGINGLARFAITNGVEAFLGYDLQRYGGSDEVLVIEQHKEQTQAVFGQVRVSPQLLPHTHLSAGFRYNHPDVGGQATVWNATGQYDFTSYLFARSTLGTSFRLPSAEELFANDPADERGNPDLKPEKTRSINASVGGKFAHEGARFSWELIAFARDIRDLIDLTGFDDATGQDVFENTPGIVKVRGGEAVLEAVVNADLSMNFSYTRNSSHTDGGSQTSKVPEHLAKAYVDFHPGSLPFGATLAVNYTGKEFNAIGPTTVEYGKYAVVDISGRYFIDANRKHTLILSLQNVLDKQYGSPARGCTDVATDGPNDCSSPYIYSNLGLPRTFRASYTYSFQ